MTYVLRMVSRVEVNLGSAADMKNTNGMINTAESKASLSSYDWEKNFFSLLSVSEVPLSRQTGLTSSPSPESARIGYP